MYLCGIIRGLVADHPSPIGDKNANHSKDHFMHLYRLLSCLTFLFLSITLFGQASPNDLLKKADAQYEKQDYRSALPLYLEYQKVDPKALIIKMRIGVCYFETGSVELAKEYLVFVANDKKPLVNAYYYLAKTYHYLHDFENAAVYYKRYLANMKPDELERERVKESILQCMAGRKIIWQQQLAVVENLGNKINTIYDETAPVVDPFEANTLYFSSVEGDSASADSDIMVSRIARGEWSKGASIGPEYNTASNDQLHGFSEDGYQVVITRDASIDPNDIFVQMFFAPDDVDQSPYRLPGPLNTPGWDGDVHFFRDSIIIFSSEREGGYGGKDLYASVRIGGEWMYPENLGPEVNTTFNEESPFLAMDGRTLYFSSDNLNSMGGYDIFRTNYSDSLMAWSEPENFGYPINSGANDHYFRLGLDGIKAYFSSDRPGGEGGSDLHVAYFQSPQEEMEKESDPVVWLLNTPIFLIDETIDNNPGLPETSIDTALAGTTLPEETVEAPPAFKEVLDLGPFFYSSKDLQLAPTTVNTLDEIAANLLANPAVTVEFTAHSDSEDQVLNSLFFSLKQAERMANYLLIKGVESERIMVQSYGDQFPVALESPGESEAIAESLNRRVEIQFRNTEFANFKVNYELPMISSLMKVDDGAILKEKIKGLHYRVQVVAATRRFDDPIIGSGPIAYIERSMANEYMKYCLGMADDFTEAEGLRKLISAAGYPDAFVVPYVNGIRLSREEAIDFSAEYADLNRFLTATGRSSRRKDEK